jgi:FixJ family two-component response regulator
MTEPLRKSAADDDRHDRPATGLKPPYCKHWGTIGASQRPMIAIVDDDELVRDATLSLIRSFGYHAATFPSAEKFLESDQSQKASCLITDMQMPGLSGLDLQDRLIARGSTMPVIVVGGSLDEKTRSRALKAGALACLAKPYQAQCLAKYLEMALYGRKIGEASN